MRGNPPCRTPELGPIWLSTKASPRERPKRSWFSEPEFWSGDKQRAVSATSNESGI